MSEANNFKPDSTQSESTASTSPAWFADWADFSMPKAKETHLEEAVVDAIAPTDLSSHPASDATPTEEWNDWQTVDFPNAISADAIEGQSLYADAPPPPWAPKATAPAMRSSSSNGVIALPNWGRPQPQPSQPSIVPSAIQEAAIAQPVASDGATTAQPNVTELMSLIQELNQCNSALIDRVAQLEDALDRSETALQVEVARSQEQVMAAPQELAIAHEQVAQLTHQLEVASQTQQRQQILVQTLTTQLEHSQERVAQLEQDCGLLQERYNDQAHVLTQSENACRDLQTRLYRQQGYTLQYKAALEKCLEMPPPGYEAAVDRGAAAVFQVPPSAHHLAPQSFLPKAQRIQPWSSQSRSLTGKLGSLVNSSVDPSADELALDELELPPDSSSEIAEVMQVSFSAQEQPKPQPSATVVPLQLANQPADDALAHASVDLNFDDEAIDPRLLSAAVQPLTDLSPEAIQVGLNELQAVLDAFLNGKSEAPSDAEIALWQDLARLIEVSTDDVIKANAAQTFESFTKPSEPSTKTSTETSPEHSIAATESILDTLTSELSVDLAQQQIPPAAIPAKQWDGLKLPMSAIAAKIAAHTSPPEATDLPIQSSTPSPLVYPLRPTKKLRSLAAVDLPTFPRKSESN